MAQSSSVIYLPPGVVMPPGPAAAEVPVAGAPFDRAFFQQVLPQAIQSFCTQTKCEAPLVEVLTVDGTTHYVNGISGVSDTWVALHTASRDHEHPVQVFIPYQTIFRVAVHPEREGEQRHLGFYLNPDATT